MAPNLTAPSAHPPPPPEVSIFLDIIRENVDSDPDTLSGLRSGQKMVLRLEIEAESKFVVPMRYDLQFYRGRNGESNKFEVSHPNRTNSFSPDSTLVFQSIQVLRSLTSGQGASPPVLMRQGKMKIKGNRLALFRLRKALAPPTSKPKLTQTEWPSAAAAVSRNVWMQDSQAQSCLECKRGFGLTRRKHHCRFCGKIYCKACLVRNPQAGGAWVCGGCREKARNVSRTALSNVDSAAKADVEALKSKVKSLVEENAKQENLLNKLLIMNPKAGISSLLGMWFWPVVIPLLLLAVRFVFVGPLHWSVYVVTLPLEAMLVYVARLKEDSPFRRWLLVHLTFFKVAFRYKLLSIRTAAMPKEFSDALWELTHRTTAEEVYRAILISKGMYIKIGQVMSGRADIIPPAFSRQLQKLQDSLSSDPKEHVVETLKIELKCTHPDEIFSEFDYTPVASASIAQVHKARLKSSGQQVAVKLQHKGIDEIMRRDAKVITFLFGLTGWAFPSQKPIFDAVTEFVKKMEPELDFECEARNLRKAVGAIDDASKDIRQRVVIPRPIVGMVTRRVLIMEWIEAKRLPNAEAAAGKSSEDALDAQQLQDVADSMCAAFAHLMLVKGEFMCDPHPGNFLVQPGVAHLEGKREKLAAISNATSSRKMMKVTNKTGSKLVILDFGMSAKLSRRGRLGFCKLVLAVKKGDIDALLNAFKTMGVQLRKLSERDREGVMFFFSHFYRDTAPAKENRGKFMEFIKEAKRRRKEAQEAGEKQKNGMTLFEKVPVDWVYFNRTYTLLRGAMCQLGARVSVLDIYCAAAREAIEIDRKNKQRLSTDDLGVAEERKGEATGGCCNKYMCSCRGLFLLILLLVCVAPVVMIFLEYTGMYTPPSMLPTLADIWKQVGRGYGWNNGGD